MFKKLTFIAAVLFSTAALCFGQELQQLPNDPAVRVGKLDNGMTYYIRHNDKPAQRAEFYLATNVGAIQETPDQDGLAHFLEHMCFNGTKNFPGKGILNWLESIGASFGGNVNASTGVEQTVYLLNNIPLIRPTVVDTCLLIMHDYSHFVTCDPKEIDDERGVILEERRSRRNAAWRTHEASMPYLYGDSKYASCTVIGSEENLKTFKPESLTEFYHTWYRPDMQALIVVGDINVDEVESKIKSTFADIPASENPRAKDVIKVPDNVEPIVGVITDPETASAGFNVYWKSEPAPEALNSTAIGFLTQLVKSLTSAIMNERFNDLAKSNAPFINAGFATGNLCETVEVVNGSVYAKDGLALESFEAMLSEIEKMHRFGFSDSEVERAKTEILSRFETAANQADTRKNAEFVNPLINNFFDNWSFMDPTTEYEVAKALLQQVSAPLLNQIAAQLITRENMVVLYTGPEREGVVTPTEAQIREVIAKVENAEYEQSFGEDVPSEFLDASKLKGSKVKKSSNGIYGSEVITLGNGVKVILLPTDCEKDDIELYLYKRGGMSLISDEDLYSFESNLWQLYLQNTGVAGFPSQTVSKMLAGKQVGVAPFISQYQHGISGSSTRKDFETALQLLYLYFTEPRFDAEEYEQGRVQVETILPNLQKQSNWKLQEEINKTIYDSPRAIMLNDETLDKANLATLERNYRKLFKDAAGATLIVVGDFDKAEVLPLIGKYVGSLPKGKKATEWTYRGDGIVDGRKTDDFKAEMQTPAVTVLQVYKSNAAYDIKADVSYSALSYILDMIYTATLREEEGGTYGASSNTQLSDEPNPFRLLQVVFQTNEEQADKLRELAVAGLRGIAENGPDAEKFDKTKKNLEKNIPENKLHNSWWLTVLTRNEKFGYDYVAGYEAAVEALTPEDIKAAAAELLNSGNFIEIVMRPEAPKSGQN